MGDHGCGDTCRCYPGKRNVDWALAPPSTPDPELMLASTRTRYFGSSLEFLSPSHFVAAHQGNNRRYRKPLRDWHFRVRKRQNADLGLNNVYAVSVLAQPVLVLNPRRQEPPYCAPGLDRLDNPRGASYALVSPAN
jgi:hypothetical protein